MGLELFSGTALHFYAVLWTFPRLWSSGRYRPIPFVNVYLHLRGLGIRCESCLAWAHRGLISMALLGDTRRGGGGVWSVSSSAVPYTSTPNKISPVS
jgi:hypothetical protein